MVSITWGTGVQWYAARDLQIEDINIVGRRILDAGQINVTRKSDNVGMVGTMSITLADDDGALRTTIDANEVEYALVTVYQWFDGLTLKTELCKIFVGHISDGIQWSEGERTFSFEAETRVMDREVGFSADLGSLPFLNPDAVDRAWPLGFGSVMRAPALKLTTASRGQLRYPFRGPRVNQPPTTDPYHDDGHFYLQDGDGVYFPQSVNIQVEIDGVIFAGQFLGTDEAPSDKFQVQEANLPKYQGIGFTTRGANNPSGVFPTPDPDEDLLYMAWIGSLLSIVNHYVYVQLKNKNTFYGRVVFQQGNKIQIDQRVTASENAGGIGPFTYLGNPTGEDVPNPDPDVNGIGAIFMPLGPGDTILQVAKNGCPGWAITESSSVNDQLQKIQILSEVPWRFPGGTDVVLWAPERKDVYVANLIPSDEVVSVWANRRNAGGGTELRPIPPEYYDIDLNATLVVNNRLGAVTVHPTTITFPHPLRDYVDQGWSDTIYVAYISTVGPNPADVIKWLYDTYSQLATDATSFATAATALTNYPCGFAYFAKGSVAAYADEVAFQALCGLIVDNGEVFIKYLGTAPSVDLTVDEDVLRVKTTQLEFTRTTDLITYLEGKYKLDYVPEKRFDKVTVFIRNTDKFGLRKRTIDFYIYNVAALAIRAINFWGYRYANSWRLARINSTLAAFRLEMFDTVELALADTSLFQIASINGVVHETSYAHKERRMSVELWLPSRAGTKVVDPSAYLTDPETDPPPDPIERLRHTAFDYQYPNDESRRRVTLAQDGGAYPGVVANLEEIGDPTSDAGSTVQAKVDIYGNGFGSPPTKVGVPASAINDASKPTLGAKCTVITRSNKTYFDVSDQGAKLYKVTTAFGGTVAGKYGLTPYDKPGGSSTGDEVQTGYEENDNETVPVGKYVNGKTDPDGNIYFPFGGDGSTLYKITTVWSAGFYGITPWDYPGGSSAGSETFNGYEQNFSETLPVGEYAQGKNDTFGNVYLDLPLGSC